MLGNRSFTFNTGGDKRNPEVVNTYNRKIADTVKYDLEIEYRDHQSRRRIRTDVSFFGEVGISRHHLPYLALYCLKDRGSRVRILEVKVS